MGKEILNSKMTNSASYFIAMPHAKLSGIVYASLSESEWVREVPLNNGVRYEIHHPKSKDESLDCGAFEVIKMTTAPKHLRSFLDRDEVDESTLSSWTKLSVAEPDYITEESQNKEQELFERLLQRIPDYVFFVSDQPLPAPSESSGVSQIRDVIRSSFLINDSQGLLKAQKVSSQTRRGRPPLIEDEFRRAKVLAVLTELHDIRHENHERTWESIYEDLGKKHDIGPRTVREWRTKYPDLNELSD